MGRSFLDQAKLIRFGGFLDDAAEKLQEVVGSVEETGKPAKLVITLSVKPAARAQGAVVISDKIKADLPTLPVGETILFVTNENNLVADDPRQKNLEFRAVSNVPAAVEPNAKQGNGV